MDELRALETNEKIVSLSYLIEDLIELYEKYENSDIEKLINKYITRLFKLIVKIKNPDIRERALLILNHLKK